MDAVKKEVAIREALRIFPNVSPVMAGWVYDYVESIGEAEMERRIESKYYEQPEEKCEQKSIEWVVLMGLWLTV